MARKMEELLAAFDKALGRGGRLDWEAAAAVLRSKLTKDEAIAQRAAIKALIAERCAKDGKAALAQTINTNWARLLARAYPTAATSGLSKEAQQSLGQLRDIDAQTGLVKLIQNLKSKDLASLTLIGELQTLLESLGLPLEP